MSATTLPPITNEVTVRMSRISPLSSTACGRSRVPSQNTCPAKGPFSRSRVFVGSGVNGSALR
ncbi:hypothetical protein [Methylobacterium sp. J-030]|uniref:hypothetical protein n=1 Tax=Methylobacterium sp. J-030 TaxID=2836627 RepID=UPI001FBB0490|nr:hypothetical protein [Methylobacterium sp. J-030]